MRYLFWKRGASLITLSSFLFAAGASLEGVDAAEYYVASYFSASSLCLTPNERIPDELAIPYRQSGLKISADVSGEKANLASDYAGKFDACFLPYSSTTYSSTTYEGGSFSNAAEDLRSLSFTFSSGEESFSLVFTGGGYGNHVTAMAKVMMKDGAHGISYYQDFPAAGRTSYQNSLGAYTYLWGTSFSNMAIRHGSYAEANVMPIRFSFDPSTMRIYGHSYGYSSYEERDVLIWDLSAGVNDGSSSPSFSPWGRYSVSLSFDEIRSGREANLILYSINGQNFSTTSFSNDAGPRVGYSTKRGVKGKRITLEKPLTYDVIDGEGAQSISLRVKDPAGGSVSLSASDDEIISASAGWNSYQEGIGFVPTMDGEYTLEAFASDLEGRAGEPASFAIEIADDETPEFVVPSFHQDQKVGDLFVVPEVDVSYGGHLHRASSKLIGPDGEEIAGKTVSLEKEGLYRLQGNYEKDGVLYQESFPIRVSRELPYYLVARPGMDYAYETSRFDSSLSGVRFTSSRTSATLSWEREIPLSSLDKDFLLAEVIANPDGPKEEANAITFTLTDEADEENQVRFVAKQDDSDESMSYGRAGSAEQTLAALDVYGSPVSSAYAGTPIAHSFYGESHKGNLADRRIRFYFDNEEKRVFTTGGVLVADLDDPSLFLHSWKGFTGNSVKLSISVSGLSASKASFLLTQMAGYSLTHESLVDSSSPEANALFDEVPTGLVGTPYPLLPYSLTDNLDAHPYREASVTYGGENVPLESDSFTPSRPGNYHILYRFYDHAGNVKEENIVVPVALVLPELTLSLSSESQTSGFVGEKISIPSFQIFGGSGLYHSSVSAVGKTSGTSLPIDDSFSFRPLSVETYFVLYKVQDYLGNQAKKSFEVSVSLSPAPIIEAEVSFEDPFFVGKTYSLPSVMAKDYSANPSSPTNIPTSLSYVVDSRVTAIEGTAFTPQGETGLTNAYLRYSASNGTASSYQDIPIQVINPKGENGLEMARYFLMDGFSVNSTTGSLDFSTTQEGASLRFAKPVYSDGFELDFAVLAEANSFQAIDVRLSSAENPTKAVLLSVEKGQSGSPFSPLFINGSYVGEMAGDFYEQSAQRLRLAYAESTRTITDNASTSFGPISSYEDGSSFQGFGPMLRVQTSLRGVSGDSLLRLYQIGNQRLSSLELDATAPEVILDGELVRSVGIGETVTLPSAFASDVLSDVASFGVRVLDPEGNVILSQENYAESVSFVASKYGDYNVIFQSSDSEGNTASFLMVVSVEDKEPPHIVLKGNCPKAAKANEAVKLPSASAEDGQGQAECFVFLIDPSDRMSDITTALSFVASQKGTYIIRYYAVDESGNSAFLDFTVEVN